MRRSKINQLGSEAAKELMAPEDYETLLEAIENHKSVIFRYTDRFGVFAQYRQLWPRGFYVCDVPGPHTKKCY